MHLTRTTSLVAAGALTAAAVATAAVAPTAALAAHTPSAPAHSKHVLLISIDGMHQSDLDWYVAQHPSSTLAKLAHAGSEYTDAMAANPS